MQTVIAAVLALSSSAQAYVDATPTLSRLIQDSTHIAVLQVVKVNKEKQLILYKKVADLKGRLDQVEIKHRITDGLHPREPRTVLDWVEPGKTALCFANDKVSQICLGHYWYECAVQELPWWVMTRGRPELSLVYHGAAAKLRHHVTVMLAGKETVITAVLHGVGRWQGYEPVAFKQSLRGKEVPIGRIKASLTMPDWVGELMSDPRFLIGQDGGSPEEVPALLQGLEDKTRGTRVEAAENLGLLGRHARAALPALTKALHDPDRLVRIRAAGALLRIDPHVGNALGGVPHQKAALAVLLQAIKDADVADRKAAVETLGEIGLEAQAVVPVLIETLKDPDPGLRWAAAEALGQFGRQAGAAVHPLMEALKDSRTRPIAIDALGMLGPKAKAAIPALTLICQNQNPILRWAAAVAIIRIEVGGPESAAIRAAVPLFVDGLKSRDAASRWQAVWCFKWLGSKGKTGIPALIQLASHKDVNVCVAALQALAAIGPVAKAAVPTLREKLKDVDGEVRIVAAEALFRIVHDSQTAVSVCTKALKESDPRVRILATQLLGEMGPQAKAADLALLGALTDEDRSVRWSAASALGSLGSEAKGRITELVGALKNNDPRVRAHVAELLGKLGPESKAAGRTVWQTVILPALVETLQDGDVYVRITAAESLLAIAKDTPALVGVLVKTLNETDTDLRVRAIHLLGQIGRDARPAIPLLTPLLDHEDPDVRQVVAETLKKLEPVSALQAVGPGDSGPDLSGKILVGTLLAAAVVFVSVSSIFLRRRLRNARDA